MGTDKEVMLEACRKRKRMSVDYVVMGIGWLLNKISISSPPFVNSISFTIQVGSIKRTESNPSVRFPSHPP